MYPTTTFPFPLVRPIGRTERPFQTRRLHPSRCRSPELLLGFTQARRFLGAVTVLVSWLNAAKVSWQPRRVLLPIDTEAARESHGSYSGRVLKSRA